MAAAEPLLGADLESGQAAAAPKAAPAPKPKGQKRAAAKGKTAISDDILPNMTSLAWIVQKLVKEHPERLRVQYEWAAMSKDHPEKWAAWVHYYSTYLPAVLRLIKTQFLSEMQNLKGGKAVIGGGLKLATVAMRGGAQLLIKTIQVAENIKNMASQHKKIYELICVFLPTVQSTVLDGMKGINNDADKLEIEITLKFVHLFCLMALYAVPPMGTNLVRQFGCVNIQYAHLLLADPLELLNEDTPPANNYYPLLQGKWGRAESADTPTVGKLTFKDYIHANFKAKFGKTENTACGPDEWERDPIHPNWLNLDSGLLFACSYYFGSLKVQDNSNMTEEKLLAGFVDLVSAIIGELKNELELLQTMQNKVVAGISTSFLSGLTVALHMAQKAV